MGKSTTNTGGADVSLPTLDKIDKVLLTAVQKDSTQTIERLAAMAGASPSAVQRRVKRLAAKGIIRGYVACVDAKRVGRRLTFVVTLQIERKAADLYTKLARWVKNCDAVQQCYNVTGEDDFVLVITAESMEEYDLLMEQLLDTNPNVRRFTTRAVLQTFKDGRFVPVSA